MRLRRYVGREKGYEPITQLARARYEEAAKNPALLGPWIVEAQQYLDNQTRYMDGVEELLKKSGIKGWQKDMQTLRRQIDEYGAWIRTTVLPRARTDEPAARQKSTRTTLKQFGVDMDPRELIDRAHRELRRRRARDADRLARARRDATQAGMRTTIATSFAS